MLMIELTVKDGNRAATFGDPGEAATHFRKALTLIKQLPEPEKALHRDALTAATRHALNQLLVIYTVQGQTQCVLDAHAELCFVDPQDTDPYLKLGTLCRKHGLLDASIEILNRVLLLNPKHSKAKIALMSAQTDRKLSLSGIGDRIVQFVAPAMPPVAEGSLHDYDERLSKVSPGSFRHRRRLSLRGSRRTTQSRGKRRLLTSLPQSRRAPLQ